MVTGVRPREWTRQRRGPTAASLVPAQASEVRRDGLQGVLSRTVDVHVLEGGAEPGQTVCQQAQASQSPAADLQLL